MRAQQKKHHSSGVEINPMLLRVYYQERGFTQYELSQKVGVSVVTIYKWLKGETRPKTETFYKLCDVLQIEPNVLVAPTSGFINDSKHVRVLRFHAREMAGLNEPPTYSESAAIEQSLANEGQMEAEAQEVKAGQATVFSPQQSATDTESDTTDGDE